MRRYSVPYLLSFSGRFHAGTRHPVLIMGRGEAGWTVADFGSLAEAQRFADATPLCSRVPNHGITTR